MKIYSENNKIEMFVFIDGILTHLRKWDRSSPKLVIIKLCQQGNIKNYKTLSTRQHEKVEGKENSGNLVLN